MEAQSRPHTLNPIYFFIIKDIKKLILFSSVRIITIQLGSEILTPFGRSQMFQLGTSYRQKYGFLLNFDPDLPQRDNQNQTLPVFRTTSQHRMYHSALNFAAGFFGLPIEGKYHQSILIEHKGFNNSLAPYMSCPNSERPERANAGHRASQIWQESSLIETQKRLNQMVSGIQFSISHMLVNLYSL